MTPPPLADVPRLERLLAPEPIPDNDRAVELLSYASELVRGRARRTWLDDDGALLEVPEGIAAVTAAMVDRAVRNPSGSTQENAGPFSSSWGPRAHERIYLTAADRQIIDAHGKARVGTLSTTRGPVETVAAGGPGGHVAGLAPIEDE